MREGVGGGFGAGESEERWKGLSGEGIRDTLEERC